MLSPRSSSSVSEAGQESCCDWLALEEEVEEQRGRGGLVINTDKQATE